MTTEELESKEGAASFSSGTTMKALVYHKSEHGAGSCGWEERPIPLIQDSCDAIVRITATTICGTDLHILKGDVPSVADGRILGHEGVGVIEQIGSGVAEFHVGDRVIISCITSCNKCEFCRKGMLSHCRNGGWILGNAIDGTQAQYVRIPRADGSLYRCPEGSDEEALVMLSDVLPTGFECGVLNGQIMPGDTVAIVGSGPIGLAVLMTAQFYSPEKIFMIDLDDNRLVVARELGATTVINSSDGNAVSRLLELTGGDGVDVVVEAVGVPAAFDICQGILGVGGRLASVGVYGKPVELHLERLWDRNIRLTTRLVDTVTLPMLQKTILSGKLQPRKLITHSFDINEIERAYETFENAAKERALKVVLSSK